MSIDSSILRKVLPLLMAGIFAARLHAEAEGGIPLARGTVWTGRGLGSAIHGGVSLGSDDVAPMTRMEGTVWYHYKRWFVGGADFNLAMAFPSDEARLFLSRYELFTSAIWPIGDASAFQVLWIVSGGKRDFYADTAIGTPPVLQASNALGSGLLASVGTRVRDVVGLELSGGGRWSWWMAAKNGDDLEWTWEVEPGISMGLHRLWPRADSLTRAMDVSLRIPMEYTPKQVDLSNVHNRNYLPTQWQTGIRLGLAVVF